MGRNSQNEIDGRVISEAHYANDEPEQAMSDADRRPGASLSGSGRVDRAIDRFREVAGVLAGAAFIAVALRLCLEFLTERLHWSVAALFAAFLTTAAVWITYEVKSSTRVGTAAGVAGILALGLLTLAVVGAWISYMLHVKGLAVYTVPADYSVGTFVDQYLYVFLDLLPGIEVWKTLSVKPRIEPKDAAAGLPILGFKIFVVWLFLDAFRSWRKASVASSARHPEPDPETNGIL